MMALLGARSTLLRPYRSLVRGANSLNSQAAASQLAIGIDLGTTQSVVTYLDGGRATVIPDEKGRNATPSVVAHRLNADDLVGHAALQQAVVNPKGTFAATKRLMGRLYSDNLVRLELTRCQVHCFCF
eukprot:m.103099 g.103099  ORF g.103099 m.103099 type:complete len:128 (+) comp15210_c0_seq3:71-454(+)